jgi:hypothetical protein
MVDTAMKIDLKRELGDLYRARTEPAFVDVPAMRFLMIDGHGDPERSVEFNDAVEALYSVSYGLKFRARSLPGGHDFAVMPLEGLWWKPDAHVWDFGDKSDWNWTLIILQPEIVTEELVHEIVIEAADRKQLPALAGLHFDVFDEGQAAQVIHVGPYSSERPTLEKLYAFIKEAGRIPVGKHHEIYLGDPRRTAPHRLRTIVRQPLSMTA